MACPMAELVAKHCINFPTHLRINDPEQFTSRIRKLKKNPESFLLDINNQKDRT